LQFDGSDSKKLRGFLLQCKLNFWSKPISFHTEQSKVNHSLSFLKGTTLDYFELYLTDDPENEPAWLNDYELFVEELLINFSSYNMIADAEVELGQLIMKDNHKATKFLLVSTDSPHFLSPTIKCSTEGHTSPFQRGSRMKWYTSTNLTHLTNSRTSFRKSTSTIGNERENSHKRSCLPPRKR